MTQRLSNKTPGTQSPSLKNSLAVASLMARAEARSLKTEEEIVAIRYGIKVVEERLN